MAALLDELGRFLLVFLHDQLVFLWAYLFKQLGEILVSTVNRQPLVYSLLSLLDLIELLICLGLAVIQFQQNSLRPLVLCLDILSACAEHQPKVVDAVDTFVGGFNWLSEAVKLIETEGFVGNGVLVFVHADRLVVEVYRLLELAEFYLLVALILVPNWLQSGVDWGNARVDLLAYLRVE